MTPIPPSSPLSVWVVSDGRAGIQNQALGLAEAVKRLTPAEITIKHIRWRRVFDRLPSALKTTAMLAPASDPIIAPWPDLWIATGRATLPLSTRVKTCSGGRTFVVQTQDPRWANLSPDFSGTIGRTWTGLPVEAASAAMLALSSVTRMWSAKCRKLNRGLSPIPSQIKPGRSARRAVMAALAASGVRREKVSISDPPDARTAAAIRSARSAACSGGRSNALERPPIRTATRGWGRGAMRSAKAGAASAMRRGVMRWGEPVISKTLSPDRPSWAGATIMS